jgi:ABC-type nitrate/sulfonate/bicarbonate transport system substrate-binding protein
MSMAEQNVSTNNRLKLVFSEATGSYLVLLAVAKQQQLFEKYGVEVEPVPVGGATVPRVTPQTPVGLIGEPAAILQAAEGADLRIIASLSSTPLSGHLVARPTVKSPDDLRGKRVGVRVLGAGIWISTILALEQLGLSPERDGITAVPVGSPVQIVRALEQGAIDAALVTVAQSRALQARDYTVLLADYPAGISAYGLCLAATTDYITARMDVVQDITTALIEALAFTLAPKNGDVVMEMFKTSLNVMDADTALSNLREFKPVPYPSRAGLTRMRSIMATHDPGVMKVNLENLIDDRFVRKLDESGAIVELYDAHGSSRSLARASSDY